jgi:hypothetical protein
MAGELKYDERISSTRTEARFIALALFPLLVSVRRARSRGIDKLSAVLLGFFSFFLFYALNYRTLIIRLTSQALELRFGLFGWTIPLEDIEDCYRDEVSLWRIGGAGMHFTSIGRRYRVMFNFLEYPRVVVALKERRGPVRDVAFSTRCPDQLLALISEALSINDSA